MFCSTESRKNRVCEAVIPACFSLKLFFFFLLPLLYLPFLFSGNVAAQTQDKQAVDFVVCIDNSASIIGEDRVLIRETTMLLADLADVGDRISVITFGQAARTVASATITGDHDRITFKQQALQGINFQEQFSDIRAAFGELDRNRTQLLRPDNAISAVILLSDGKLEPQDHNPQAALAEIDQILATTLAGVNIYAVVLGNSSCNDPIPRMPGINGLQLMRDHIAKTPERLKHARRLDQLFEITLNILNRTKGISSLGEEDKPRFLLDDTVETMSLIVRKKGSDGKPVCSSQDIQLKHSTEDQARPDKLFSAANSMNKNHLEDSANSIYWSGEYQYFDLVVVRKPAGGHWTVELANGRIPEVLNKIVSPVQLRFKVRDVYYSGERAFLTAWIFNRKTESVVSDRGFKVQARLAVEKPVTESSPSLELHPGDKGIYALEIPRELQHNLLVDRQLPATVNVELIARAYAKAGSSEMDPWFVRRSPPIAFQVVNPFVHWRTVPEKLLAMPILGGIFEKITGLPQAAANLVFGGQLDGNHTQAPPFDLAPVLHVKIQRIDAPGTPPQTIWEENLTGKSEGDARTVYTGSPEGSVIQPGRYQFTYQLSGTKKNGGTFTLDGPTLNFQVVSYAWVLYVLAAALLLLLLFVVSDRTAKLQGQIIINGKGRPLNARVYRQTGVFELTAVRVLFVKSWIRFKSLGDGTKVNGQPLPPGRSLKLRPRQQHQVTRGSDQYRFMLNI